MPVGKPHIKHQRNVGTFKTHSFVPRRGTRRSHHNDFHNKSHPLVVTRLAAADVVIFADILILRTGYYPELKSCR